ncbi:Os03g0744200, partial [Oryza sativa Japonica Group]
IRHRWRRRRRPRVDPAADEDGSSGDGSLCPLSPPSHGGSDSGDGDRVWIRWRWRWLRVDRVAAASSCGGFEGSGSSSSYPVAAAPPSPEWRPTAASLPWCWQQLPASLAAPHLPDVEPTVV